MKVGRQIHVPKSTQMKKDYRRYIETLDYQPTVDDSIDFNRTNQGGEDYSIIDTNKRRPSDISEKIKDHFSNNWLAWVFCLLALGIGYLVYDSRVAISKFEIILLNQGEKLSDLKSANNELQKNDHAQDLKIQKNSILLNQISNKISKIEIDINKIINSQQGAPPDRHSAALHGGR